MQEQSTAVMHFADSTTSLWCFPDPKAELLNQQLLYVQDEFIKAF